MDTWFGTNLSKIGGNDGAFSILPGCVYSRPVHLTKCTILLRSWCTSRFHSIIRRCGVIDALVNIPFSNVMLLQHVSVLRCRLQCVCVLLVSNWPTKQMWGCRCRFGSKVPATPHSEGQKQRALKCDHAVDPTHSVFKWLKNCMCNHRSCNRSFKEDEVNPVNLYYELLLLTKSFQTELYVLRTNADRSTYRCSRACWAEILLLGS